ncbi:MAG: Flp family type IVb pilin [Robiginitomaculum sp.]|nr:Flp family type IVb pilin [Robiginitomaculum sp.]
MQNFVTRFMNDESGATAIEYGLIAALISVGIISAATTLGGNINNRFEVVAEAVGSAGAAPAAP